MSLALAGALLHASPALAVLDTPAYDLFHAEANLANTGQNLKPSQCPSLPPKGQKINLMQSINIALCNNQSTRASWFQLRSQAIGLNQTKVDQYIPNVTSSIGIEHDSQRVKGTTDTQTSSSGNISLGYTLFDFGVRSATVEAAEKSIQAAMLDYDSSLQGLIASTIQQYYDLLASQYSLQAAEESLRFAEESLNAAEARYQIGLVAKSDVLQTQASYSQAKLSLEQTLNSQQLAQNALLLIMGFSPDEYIEITDVDDAVLADNTLDVRVQDLIAQAELNRKDLASAKKSLEASYASLDATKRGNLPKISMSAAQTYRGKDIFQDTSHSGTLGFSVSIPIFSGFTRSYSIKSNEEQIKAQEISLEKTKLDIANDVWTAYTNYKTAEQSWMTSFDAMNSATEFRDIALGRYKAGVGSLIDVLSAQSSYASALNSQISTRFSLLTSRVNLVRAVGVLDLTNANPQTSIAKLRQ